MYRFLNLRKMKIHSLHGVTSSRNERLFRLTGNENTCVLCNRVVDVSNIHKRYQSTHTNPNIKAHRKKKTRSIRKYAELLVVTDKSTSEHKARIKKLNPEDLKFLSMTNLNLSELYKLKDMMRSNQVLEEHTYNNLTVIEDVSVDIENTMIGSVSKPLESVITPSVNLDSSENCKELIDDELSEDKLVQELGQELKTELSKEPEIILDKIASYQKVLPKTTFQPEILEEEHEQIETEAVKEEADIKGSVKNHNDLAAKQEIMTRTLAAYVEICGILNNPQRGFNSIWAHKTKSRRKVIPSIKSIEVCNAAMRGFAVKGNFNKVSEVIKYANDEEIPLNLQSYAIIFECLGRINIDNNHLKQIRIFAKEMNKDDISFDKIMNEAIFSGDQREYVLKAMKAYDRNYVPQYHPPNLQYSNPLLNHLNVEEQLNCNIKTKGDDSNCFFTKEDMRKKIQNQLGIEKFGYVTVKNIENKSAANAQVLKHRESLNNLLKSWETAALEGFNRDLAALSVQKCHMNLEPYLRSIPSKEFVNIMVDEAKLMAQGSETYSPMVNQLHRELGQKVYSRFKLLRKQKVGVVDKILKIHTAYCDNFVLTHDLLDILPKATEPINVRQKWQTIDFHLKSEGASIYLDHQPWVPTIIQKIGKFLYNVLMHDLKVDVNIMNDNRKHVNSLPAFYTIFRSQGRMVFEEVKPHPVLCRLYRASMPEMMTFSANQVPMKCPPVPWCGINTGGYLITPTDFVRLPTHAIIQKERLAQSSPVELYPSFDALNQLSAVPWKVNTKILDCVLEVFRKGGSDKLSVPENPVNLPQPPSVTSVVDKSEKYAIFRQRLQYRRKKAEMYSLWCDCLYRLSIANHYRDEVFWLPHNMDFRGRVYPVPPHFNHLGSDLARSMLVFAEARPLGPKGLDWLKLHLINLTGAKKRDSVVDRLAYADTIIDKVLDSADKPLTGAMWWVSSDEPWQTLACAMEIASAMRSGNPEEYRSHFPIHQDGSCNGLQHYAALGRDSAGGYSVNLTAAPKPQDVYSAVVSLVEERRQKDADAGVEIAKVLEGFVLRKVIKQTVMTTVYGVTKFGAKLQIARQLKDIDEFPKEHVWAGSSYLTTRTFESLRTMFTSTREIQDWFTECARLISSVCGENVEWVTPLGLPVVQPYFRYKKLLPTMHYEPYQMDKYEKPNVMKQKNAFPPNFIHSLDSSHMMLTSLHCERVGITFISVHDCYWTHPSTVNIMNKICRQQFVALHSNPILENLSNFLSEKFSFKLEDLTLDGSNVDLSRRRLNKTLKRLPKTGDFNIEKVLNSVYFFS